MTRWTTKYGVSVAFIIVAVGLAAAARSQIVSPAANQCFHGVETVDVVYESALVHNPGATNSPIWSLAQGTTPPIPAPDWMSVSGRNDLRFNAPSGTIPSIAQFSPYGIRITLSNSTTNLGDVPIQVYVWRPVGLTTASGVIATLAPDQTLSMDLDVRGGCFTVSNDPNPLASFDVTHSISGNVPSWLEYSSEEVPTANNTYLKSVGHLAGTPGTGDLGTYTFTLRVEDEGYRNYTSGGQPTGGTLLYSERTYTIEVEVPEIVATPDSGTLGIVNFGQAFAANIDAEGGYGALTYSSDDLPQWLSLDAQTGALTGTPENADDVLTHVFHISVSDEFPDTPNVATFEYSVEVITAPLTIVTPFNLPMARMGDVYTAQLHAIGGAGGFHWSVDDLPIGITLGDSGALSGIPEVEGVYPLDVAVQDDVTPPNIERTVLSLVVQGAEEALLNITTSHLPPATEGHVYTPLSLAAAGGTGSYTWEVTGLPSGMAADGDVIGGTPLNGDAGVYHVRVVVADGASTTSTIFPFVVLAAVEVIESEDALPTLPGTLNAALMSGAAAAGCSIGGPNGDSGSGIWWGWFVLGLGMIAWRSSSRTTARS
ncbi:MAG: putative Ig domain-containing protein [Planctomycetaceae bacterium]|nr:putative Ig domain-containing protein [Planctomycetaceae bacterium]